MNISDYIGIIGIIVGVIGIVVGVIGFKSLTATTKIKNTIKNANNNTIQQAQTINVGLDSYAVIKLSKDTTQQELESIVKRIDEVEGGYWKKSELQFMSNEDVQNIFDEVFKE